MNKDEIKKYEIKKGLKCCAVADYETGCSDCPYRYRCGALAKDALNIITEQEKEIEQLTEECNQQAEELAKGQEACIECELEQSWELCVRDKEIDRLRAESKRFENNMKSVHGIEKKNVAKEFAEKLKVNAIRLPAIEKYHVCNLIDELLKEYGE